MVKSLSDLLSISRRKASTKDKDVGLGSNSGLGSDFVEFAQNSEPRCACVLLVDTSSSMKGEKTRALEAGLLDFKWQIVRDRLACKRVEIAVMSFGEEVTLVQDFISPKSFLPVRFDPVGDTPTGLAIEKALDLTERRKLIYKKNGIPYFCPWIFMITDGVYTDGEDVWLKSISRVKAMEQAKKISFYAVGFNQKQAETLSSISDQHEALILSEMKFSDMFQWLSQSLTLSTRVLSGDQSELPSVDSWAEKARSESDKP